MAKSRAEQLMQRIDECNKYKEIVTTYPDKCNLRNLTQKQWLQYYDAEINHCISILESQKKSSQFRNIIIVAIMVIALASFFLLKPQLTTLAVYNPESIILEVNKSVSLSSYLLIAAGSTEYRMNLSELNLIPINETYIIESLAIPISHLNISSGIHNVVISLIDNGAITALTQVQLSISEPTTTTIYNIPDTTSSTSSTTSTTSTTIPNNQTPSNQSIPQNEPAANQTQSNQSSIIVTQSEYTIQTASSNLSRVFLTITGRLTYNNSTITRDEQHNFTFKIYNSAQSLIWEENQTVNTSSGIYTALLGISRTLNIQFNDSYALGIAINNYSQELSPRLNITHSPYAYRSNIADNVECDTCVDWYTEISNIPPGISNGTTVLTINSTGFIDAGAIKNGTLNDARLSSNISTATSNTTFNGVNTFNATTFSSNITPQTNNSYALGNETRYFQAIFVNILNLIARITSNQIAEETITSSNILNGTIQGGDLTNKTINATHIINISASQVTPNAFPAGDFNFSGNLSVDTSTLHVDSSNNRIGINTILPTRALEVNGSANITGTLYADTFNPLLIAIAGNPGTLNTTAKAFLSTSSALVGIGNIDPSRNLHIKGSTDVTARLDKAASSNDAILEFSTAESRDWAFRTPQNNDRIQVDEDLSGTLTPRLAIEAGGNTGIGLTDPNSTLEIIGNFTVDKGTLKVDDTNNRVGINTENPTQTLNVVGNTNITNNESVGNLTVTQFAIITNNLTSSNIRPSTNNSVSLGANESLFFREIYVNLLHVITQITGTQIATETITAANIQNLTITSIKIAAYAINNTHLSLYSVNGSQIAVYSINNTHLGLNTINTSQILDNTIQGGDLANPININTTGNISISNNLIIGASTFIVNNSNGSIAINTSVATRTLDVRGDINLSSLLYLLGNKVGINVTNPTRTFTMQGDINISDTFFVTGNKVGINTSNPTRALEVLGNVNISSLIYTLGSALGIGTANPNGTVHIVGQLNVTDDVQLNGSTFFLDASAGTIGINTTLPSHALNVRGDTNLSNALYVIGSNVGIGTRTPTSRLTISDSARPVMDYDLVGVSPPSNANANSNGDKLVFWNSNSDYKGAIGIDGYVLWLQSTGANGGSGSTRGIISFHTGDTTTVVERMRIDGTGKVGINSTTPSRLLDVNGAVNLSGALFTNTSKVGINITTPTTALDIQGTVNISSATSGRLLQVGSGVHGNLTMFSVDGARWSCGVLNSGAFNCTSF